MKLIYWILTAVLALSAILSGYGYLTGAPEHIRILTDMGYPAYLATLLGVWKVAGAVTVLLPGLSGLKVWAYSGFFFLFSGAFLSHIAAGQPFSASLPAITLLVVCIGSFMLRESRYD